MLSGTISFIYSISAISVPHLLHQEFQLDELLHNGEEDTISKKKKKELCPKSRPAAINLSSSIATSSSTASSPIASEKSGDADSFGETRQQDEH